MYLVLTLPVVFFTVMGMASSSDRCVEFYGDKRIVAIGDSLTRGASTLFHERVYHPFTNALAVHLPRASVETFGVNGETTAQILDRVRNIYLSGYNKTLPAVGIVWGGTNDITLGDISPNTTLGNLIDMYEIIATKGTRCIAVTIPRAKIFNFQQEKSRRFINHGIKEFVSKVASRAAVHPTIKLLDVADASRITLCEDGIHLSVGAYNAIGMHIFDSLCEWAL